jgi:hypothetical protein
VPGVFASVPVTALPRLPVGSAAGCPVHGYVYVRMRARGCGVASRQAVWAGWSAGRCRWRAGHVITVSRWLREYRGT